MALHLVTGYAGKEHVTAADQGAFNVAMLIAGNYVLNRGEKFAATIVTNNLIKVLDGEIILQGRYIRLDSGSFEELTIDSGTQDYKRNDLIVCRYTKDSTTGIESAALVVIKGTQDSALAIDPEYTVGDTLHGDLVCDFPLYRVPIDGLNVGELVPLFDVIDSLDERIKGTEDAVSGLTDGTTPVGNADKLDGYHAEDFQKGVSEVFASGETILEWATNPNGVYTKFVVSSNGYPSDAPLTVEGFVTLLIDKSKNRKIAVFFQYGSNAKVYYRRYWSGAWSGDWTSLTDYLPLSGGTLTGGLTLGNASGSEGGEMIFAKPKENTLFDGNITFDVFQNAMRFFASHNGVAKGINFKFDEMTGTHTALHTGNITNYITNTNGVKRGTYIGNGSATERVIETGGSGNYCFIWSGYGMAIVSPCGAVYHQNTSTDASGLGVATIKYSNGKITIKSSEQAVNASSIEYYYECF